MDDLSYVKEHFDPKDPGSSARAPCSATVVSNGFSSWSTARVAAPTGFIGIPDGGWAGRLRRRWRSSPVYEPRPEARRRNPTDPNGPRPAIPAQILRQLLSPFLSLRSVARSNRARDHHRAARRHHRVRPLRQFHLRRATVPHRHPVGLARRGRLVQPGRTTTSSPSTPRPSASSSGRRRRSRAAAPTAT